MIHDEFFKIIDEVCALQLSVYKKGFNFRNEARYRGIFDLTAAGVPDKVKELIRLAKIGALYDKVAKEGR